MDEKLRKLERASGNSEEDLIRFRLAQVKVGDLIGFDKPLVKWKDERLYTLLYGLISETSPVFHDVYEPLHQWRAARLKEFQNAWKDRRSSVERSIVDGEWSVSCVEARPTEAQATERYFWGVRTSDAWGRSRAGGNPDVAQHLATRALSYMEDANFRAERLFLHLMPDSIKWIQPTCLLYVNYSGKHRFSTTDGEVIEASTEPGNYPYLYGARGW